MFKHLLIEFLIGWHLQRVGLELTQWGSLQIALRTSTKLHSDCALFFVRHADFQFLVHTLSRTELSSSS